MVERNQGIDFLRIIAMLMVCIIHINLLTEGHKELIPGKECFYYVSTWSESVGYIGVNLYAMITGYVSVLGKWKFSRYMRLWCLVAFYTVSLILLGVALFKLGVCPVELSIRGCLIRIVALAAGSSYWYFAAYTGLFFLLPFINPILKQTRQLNLVLLLLVLLVLFPLLNILNSGNLYMAGYNAWWLLALYIAGAYFRLFPLKINSSWGLILIALLCTLQPVCCALLDLPKYLKYPSLIMVIYTIAVFLLFYQMNIRKKWLIAFIQWAAPLSFSVYLIHVNFWSWSVLKTYVPQWNAMLNYPWWISFVGGLSIYFVCLLIDQLRVWVFSLCRVNTASDLLSSWLAGTAIRMWSYFSKSR